MNKEPFLQVSKRRNKAGWQERLLIEPWAPSAVSGRRSVIR